MPQECLLAMSAVSLLKMAIQSLTKRIKHQLQNQHLQQEHFKKEKDKEKYEGLLQAFEVEALKVEAEYILTTLNGEEPEEIKVDNQSKAKMLFDALDDIFGGDD